MAKFLFTYHGGKHPETEEERARVMAQWGAWMGDLGAALTDGGGPCGPSRTVSDKGVANDGGANPVSGYSIVEAASFDAAVEMAKGCPILGSGTVEVTEVLDI